MTREEFKNRLKEINAAIVNEIMAGNYEIEKTDKYTINISLKNIDFEICLWIGAADNNFRQYNYENYGTTLIEFTSKEKTILHKRFSKIKKESYREKRKKELLKELEQLNK